VLLERLPVTIERLSIELTNRCKKACWFCYNASAPGGETVWTADEVVRFALDCAEHGTRAVSLGGGEPLEHPGLFDVLAGLRGRVFRSMTTHGLLLDEPTMDRLAAAAIDKVHVSVHHAGNADEVLRVSRQVRALAARGIQSGVNLLVQRSRLDDAAAAAKRLRDDGIGNDRIVYLPMRGQDTPTPADVARVAAGPFLSMTCGKSPRFAAVDWDKRAAHCSYTSARARLPSLDHAGLVAALAPLDVVFCGGTDDRSLVRLPRRAQHGHDMVRDR
jgi:organic radical activating enzyme